MSTITLLPRESAWSQTEDSADATGALSPAVAPVPVTGFSAPRVTAHPASPRRERTTRATGPSCLPERPTLPATRAARPDSVRPARPARPARAVRRPAPAGPVRLTRRGRLVVVGAFLAVLAGLMVALSGPVIATLSGGPGEQVRIVEVQPGQTLYDLAGSVARPGQVNEMVYRIEELNSLPDSDISVGQRLAVPRG